MIMAVVVIVAMVVVMAIIRVAVVGDAAIGMQGHHDLLTKASQSLIGCVI